MNEPSPVQVDSTGADCALGLGILLGFALLSIVLMFVVFWLGYMAGQGAAAVC